MKWLYRLGSLCAVCAITLSFLIVPASAATLERSMSVEWVRGSGSFSFTFNSPLYDAYTNEHAGNSVTSPVVGTKYYTSLNSILSDTEFTYEGAVGMYVSWFMTVSTGTGGTGSWSYQEPSYGGFYSNMYGQKGTIPNLEYDTFNPVTDLSNPSQGYTYKAQFLGTPELPISGLGIERTSTGAQMYWTPASVPSGTNVDKTLRFGICIPSARMIGRESTAELDALENMADAITAQSEILSAMYGEVIDVCNAIYERTGDMVAAQNLANQYFAQIIPILNQIQADTGDIVTNTGNIYSLLQTQLQALITTIQSESFEIQEVLKGESEAIQDAIDSAVERLITYFDTVFSGAVGDTPDSIQGADDAIKQEHDFTNQGFDAVDDYLDVTIPETFEPGGNVLDGFGVFKNLIESLFAVLGDFGMIFIFGWIAGLSALVIGRIRHFRG